MPGFVEPHPSILLARPRIVGLVKAAARKDWTLLGQTMAQSGWGEHEVDAFRLWLAECSTGAWQHYEDAGYNFGRRPEHLARAQGHLERHAVASRLRVALAVRELLAR